MFAEACSCARACVAGWQTTPHISHRLADPVNLPSFLHSVLSFMHMHPFCLTGSAGSYKLVISYVGMRREGQDPRTAIDWTRVGKYAIPAVLYAINNNLIFQVLLLLPPAVFQLLLHLRVVWSALLFKVQPFVFGLCCLTLRCLC